MPQDPELHAALAVLIRALATRIDGKETAAAAPSSPPPPVAPPLPPPIPISQLPPLLIGSGYTPPPVQPSWENDRDLDLLPLAIIADRCRVKSDACKLVARRVAESFDWDDGREADIARRAQALPDCHLWMLTRDPVVTAPMAWDDLAGGYLAAADAAMMLRDWEQAPPTLAIRHASKVLGLAAEAQSVLLYAVADVRDVKVDFDQVQIFAHVRSTARDRQVFIPKYLKREDRADPASWADVIKRINEVWSQFKAFGERDKQRAKALNSLKFKLGRLRDKPEESATEWTRVLELIDELVANGLPPSNAELRDMLLPVFEDIPDSPPPSPNLELVLREIDRYLDTRPEADPPARVQRASPEVAAVADLLRGREVVLIGGQNRPNHKAALMKAFGLTDVRWIVTPEHTSFTVFEPDVAAQEVALVLLAIRWSSHDYDSVRTYCEQYGKPLVRLPGGYNANQVAHHIMAQAGDRLRASVAALLAPAG
ncbi:MAG TPA: hypothetical protein VN641_01205 [Urbifossiella sp.]|nr:hypothetical protein [Urbifossiella sp.]